MANIEKFNGGYNDLDAGIRYYDDGSTYKFGNGDLYMARLRNGQAQATGDPNANKGTIQDDGFTYPAAANGSGLGGTFNASPTPAGGQGSGGTVIGGSPVSGGAGGGGLGLSGGVSTAGQNPYLEQLKKQTADQMTDSWNRSVLPGIQQGAVASGGYGGSRQGVIEANAMNDLGRNISSALTGLDAGAFNQSLNYDLGLRNNQLGYYNAQNNYDLGLRGNQLGYGQLGLGYAGLDRQINNDNIANQMNGVNLGLSIYDRLRDNNNAALNAGNNIQNTPLNYFNNFTNAVNGIANGYGTSNGSTSNNGNSLLGMAGGAQLGGQLYDYFGARGGGSSGKFDPGEMGRGLANTNKWWD